MKTLAVHLHLYYLEQFPEILDYLENLKGIDFDLFITMPKEDGRIRNKVQELYQNASIYIVENRGYDIGPFIDFLHQDYFLNNKPCQIILTFQ